MGDTTCRMPGCDESTRDDGRTQFANAFCSKQHELKYEHIRNDARDAERADKQEARERAERRRDLPEYDGPPY